jgi:hypothetical protein
VPETLCENWSLATGKHCGKPASIAAIRRGQAVTMCADCALKEYRRSKAGRESSLRPTGRVAGLPFVADAGARDV